MYSTRAFCKKRPEFGHCVSQRRNVITLWRNVTSWHHVDLHGDGCLQTPVVYDYPFNILWTWIDLHWLLCYIGLWNLNTNFIFICRNEFRTARTHFHFSHIFSVRLLATNEPAAAPLCLSSPDGAALDPFLSGKTCIMWRLSLKYVLCIVQRSKVFKTNKIDLIQLTEVQFFVWRI